MKENEKDIEHILEHVPVPKLREGPHRDRLKEALLNPEYKTLSEGREQMNPSNMRRRRWLQLAAGLLAAAVLVASGWAAEKAYERLVKKEVHVEIGDGWNSWLPEDTPSNKVEQMRERHAEVSQLIARKQYKLVDTFDEEGGTNYIYQFTFSDGTKDNMNFSIPLDNIESMEDYLNKAAAFEKQRKEDIRKAVLAGKYRLIGMEPEWTHVCIEKGTGRKLTVLCVTLHDDARVAVVSDEKQEIQYKTSWQDHLDAVRRGERELVDLNVIVRYLYEITLDDGSTTTYQCGGKTTKPIESLEKMLLEPSKK